MKIENLTPSLLLKNLRAKEKESGKFQEDFENHQAARWACIEEIERRGINFLKELNWPFAESGIYKNRYTACEETLEKMYGEKLGPHRNEEFEIWLRHEIPFICENWLPKEIWTDDECFSEYLPKNKLTGWFK